MKWLLEIPGIRQTVAVAAAAMLVGGGVIAQAQTPSPDPHAGHTMQTNVDEAEANAMMAGRKQMMADMQAMDQELNELVASMNAASGSAKVDAVAVVVQRLVAQRTEMQQRMMTMQDEMMGHMMHHMMSMQGGTMGGGGQMMGGEQMMSCPMMQMMHGGSGDQNAPK